ncbi:hypothetical protein EBQ81_00370 [bacterium]|nr:hypothetical protein [bacterium]
MSNIIYSPFGFFRLGPIPDAIPDSEKIQGITDENLNIYWSARKSFSMPLNKFYFLKNIATNWTLNVTEVGEWTTFENEACPNNDTTTTPLSTDVVVSSPAYEDTILNSLPLYPDLEANGTSIYKIQNDGIDPGGATEKQVICPGQEYPTNFYDYNLEFSRSFSVAFGLGLSYLDPNTLTVWPNLTFGGNYIRATWEGLGNLDSRVGENGINFNGTAKIKFAGYDVPADFVAVQALDNKNGNLSIFLNWQPNSKKPLA